MSLEPGTKLGAYEILDAIGAGGMGEVYKARDTKLDREVAIKVLPEILADDEERLARLEREAKLLASINHPAIATLHGLEDVDGTRLLVMELVEGEDLAARLRRGPLSLEVARRLFGQIAEGLDAAHEKGVIHRDLKPANIMITERDGVKILDFGLAKAFDENIGEMDPSRSPTVTKGTATGVIMGTASYMSPEQARGKSVDKRTDIWAFGCCLYEALAGRKAFDADNVTDILAAIVHHEPDWEALPAATPASARALLRKCLTKDPMKRLRDIGDASFEDEAHPSVATSRPSAWPWVVAAAGVVAGLVGFQSRAARPDADARVRRFTVTLPERASLAPPLGQMGRLALSRDGRKLAFLAGRFTLYLRDVDSFEATLVPGAEGALNPIFSPDSRWVAFATTSMFKKASTDGGPPIDVTPVSPVSRGASWGLDDQLVVSPSYSQGLIRVSASGGEPEQLTVADRSKAEANHLWPQVLDDGDRIVFTIWGGGSFDDATIVLLSRATGQYRTLIDGGSYGRVTSSGHLVFARGGSLFAVPFDRDRGEVDGSPIPVLNGVLTSDATGVAQFDVSDDGTLAYIPAGPEHGSFLTWVDRERNVERMPVEARSFFGPRLSPDGSRLLATILTDVWVYDLNRDASQRLTFRAINLFANWSADGQEIIYASTVAGEPKLYSIATGGGGEPRAIGDGENLVEFPGSESVLGYLAYSVAQGPGHDFDIWTLKRGEDGSAKPFVETPFNEGDPEFSPDGRFIAYVSDETGRAEVFVRAFPDSGAKWSVSSGEGTEPSWAPDGKSLYYRSPSDMMMVDVETEPSLSVSRPRALFEDTFENWPGAPGYRNYDISPDGERFLMLEPSQRDEYDTIHVVLNWFEELEQLVPTR